MFIPDSRLAAASPRGYSDQLPVSSPCTQSIRAGTHIPRFILVNPTRRRLGFLDARLDAGQGQ